MAPDFCSAKMVSVYWLVESLLENVYSMWKWQNNLTRNETWIILSNLLSHPIWPPTSQGQALVEEVVVAALQLYTATSTTKVIVAHNVAA